MAAPAYRRFSAKFAKDQLPWLSLVLFYAVLANVPYWVAAHEFEFATSGWFCLLYVCLGLLALVIPRFAAAGLLVIAISLDLLCSVCVTYFLPIRQCLENLRAIGSLSGPPLMYAGTAVLAILFVAGVAFMLRGNSLPRRKRWYAAATLAVFASAIACTDFLSISLASGRPPALIRAQPVLDGITLRMSKVPRLSRIPLLRLVHLATLEVKASHQQAASVQASPTVPSATSVAIRAAGIFSGESQSQLPNVVLVLLESWGIAEDSPLREALVKPYAQPDLLAKYQVIQGTVPFYGPTIAGEARELCGSRIGFRILIASANELKNCLPDQLGALGYESIALHGFRGRMFNRSFWYANIGFQQRWFYGDLKRVGLRDCPGAFTGTCDADIAAWIGRRLEDGRRPYFVHWMTLNSHIPVLVPAPLSDGAPCTSDLELAPDTPLCSWYQLVESVHRSVAQVAMGPLARPTVFVIVGDHVPPFGGHALYNKFSRSDVPYVVLVPRGASSPTKTTLAHSARIPNPVAIHPSPSRP